jgi:hypothetical protein
MGSRSVAILLAGQDETAQNKEFRVDLKPTLLYTAFYSYKVCIVNVILRQCKVIFQLQNAV